MTVLLDTGPLVAAADRSDKHHEPCAALFRELAAGGEPLLVPAPVMVEVCWLLAKFRGPDAEAQFLDVIASGALELVSLIPADLHRMAELVRRYGDFPLGAVDASVVAIAERLGILRLATPDHRHFSAVRPVHAETFVLLP